MNMIREQVNELRTFGAMSVIEQIEPDILKEQLNKAADTIEFLLVKSEEKNVDGRKWTLCGTPPSHTNEVLIFNGKSYSIGYYDGKEWVNAIHPVKWQEINHMSKCET